MDIRAGLLVLLISGCSVPGLTSSTSVPLDIKGIKIGDHITCESNSEDIYNNVRLCHLVDLTTFGGATVDENTIALLDEKVSIIKLALTQRSGFNQAEVLSAMASKFGPPARGGQPRTHIWTNNRDTMYLDEIRGTVVLYGADIDKTKNIMSIFKSNDL